MNLFKGLIHCNNCGKNYKFKMSRKQPSYICSGFANYGKEFCSGFTIKEQDLIEHIIKHFDILNRREGKPFWKNRDEINLELLINQIKIIEVKNRGYTIYFKNDTKTIITTNGASWGIEK